MKILNETKLGVTHYEKSGTDYYFGQPSVTYNKLPPGVYTLEVDKSGAIYVAPMQVVSDGLITLPDFTSEIVIKDVNNFWNQATRDKFERRNIVYKRGILMHGKPGTGKTSCVMQIMEAEVKAGGIVFFGPTPGTLTHALKAIREIEGNIRCLVVWEEFDSALNSDESGYLSLLDGQNQIDNIVYLATTNYLDRIPARFRNRPSRFASVIEIPLPNEATRRLYITSKLLPDENIDVDLWVKETDGMTIDHLKDLVISVLCLNVSFQDAIDRLKEYRYDEDKDDEETERQSSLRKWRKKFNLSSLTIDEDGY